MDIYQELSSKFLIDENALVDYIKRAPHKYKVYQIPKRNGSGTRTIAQPTPELKVFQRAALAHWLLQLPVHDSAFAYREKIGIKQNAEKHASNQYLLKMDFSDFFPSIRDIDLIAHIQRHHGTISERDQVAIKKLFFWRPKGQSVSRLSIGAPSSPFISNTILFEFDQKLSESCSSMGITYTRYADDLTFTTNIPNILSGVPGVVDGLLRELSYPTLIVNSRKTVFSSKKSNRHVTGLVISNEDKVSLGRDRKRFIRSMVYKFSQGSLEQDDTNKLKGYLGFAKNAEPDFYQALIKKYSYKTIRAIETD